MTRWLGRAAVAACAWGALVGYAELDDRQPHYLGLAAAVVAVLAVGWLCTDAYQVSTPPQWELYHSSLPGRTFDPRFSRLSQALAEAPSRESAARAVHTGLEAIADQILRDRYGVDRADDPEAARRILGPQTADYLAVDPAREKDVFSDRLFDTLTRLESL